MKSDKYEAPEPNVVQVPKLSLVRPQAKKLSRATAWKLLWANLEHFQPKARRQG